MIDAVLGTSNVELLIIDALDDTVEVVTEVDVEITTVVVVAGASDDDDSVEMDMVAVVLAAEDLDD